MSNRRFVVNLVQLLRESLSEKRARDNLKRLLKVVKRTISMAVLPAAADAKKDNSRAIIHDLNP